MVHRPLFIRYLRDDDGLAAVEFALIAPFLILLLLGMVDFGMYINQRMQLENLSRSAAEYVVKGGDESAVMEDVIVMSGKIDEEDMDEVTVNAESVCECSDGEEVVCGSTCSGDGYQRKYYSFSMSRTYSTMFPYPGVPESITMSGDARLQIQ